MGDATHEVRIVGRSARVHERSRVVNGRPAHEAVRPTIDPRPALFADSSPPISREPTPSRPATESAPPDLTASAITGLPVQSLRARVVKRSMDLCVGIPLCVVFAIAYPFVAVALKVTSKGPVLFRQIRVGKDGAPIAVLKFRSMSADAEGRLEADPDLYRRYVENGFKIPASIDPRITRVGRFLRKTSIDELPQALCLVSGAMTLVGPRPILAEEMSVLYKEDAGYYTACKPGLTGLWQVSGRSTVTYDDRAQLDVSYATGWTVLGDLRILARTVPVVLTTHGAH